MIIDTLSSLGGMFSLFAFIALFGLFYHYILRTWFYFSDRNVKFVRGIPLIGSLYRSLLGLEPAAITYRRYYRRFANEKFIGMYDLGGKPFYMIRDPKLIKQVTTTDFDHFINPKFTFGNENDLLAHTLFGMRNREWRQMRMTMNPTFSTNQLRSMHKLMVHCCEQFVDALKETDKTAKMFDTRDLFSRYANDIIATTAFGVELNSLREPDNDFFKVGSSLAEFRYLDGLKFLANLSFPSVFKSLDIRVTRDKNLQFMRTIVKQNIAERKNRDIGRNDMIDLLIRARDGKLQSDDDVEEFGKIANIQNWTDDDIVAQCMIFFLGGYSSISSTACFMFHELSLNPDIQAKLFKEIQSVKAELNGSPLTYDSIEKLKYLDMVVCETLRRWSPIPFIERTCNLPYVLENGDGKKVTINIGDEVLIPIFGLHMDDKYFSNPDKFDPERFSDENKDSIQSGTYLPFGIGPRNCIGSRFANMEIKTLTYYLLSEFYIDRSARTQDPLELKSLPYTMDAEKGFFVELRRRSPDRSPFKSSIFT